MLMLIGSPHFLQNEASNLFSVPQQRQVNIVGFSEGAVCVLIFMPQP